MKRIKYCEKHDYPIVMRRLYVRLPPPKHGFKGIAWFCPICRNFIFDDEKSER